MPNHTLEADALAQELIAAIQTDDLTKISDVLADGIARNQTSSVAVSLADRLGPPNQVETQLAAIVGLTRLGSPAPKAVEALGEALLHSDTASVRRTALSALETIAPIDGIRYFQVVANDPELGGLPLISIGIGLERAVANAEQLLLGPDSHGPQATIPKVSRQLLEQLLKRPVNVEGASVSAAAVVALVATYGLDAVEPLCDYLMTWLHDQEKAEQGLAVAEDARYEAGRQRTAVTVIRRLGLLADPAAIECLSRTLEKNLHTETRVLAARNLALNLASHEAAIRALCRAALSDSDRSVRRTVAELLGQKVVQWQIKTDTMLKLLAADPTQHRGTLAIDLVLKAISPPEQPVESEWALTDHLVAQVQTYGNDQRLLSMLAALIIASTGGVRKWAAERLNAYQKTGAVEEKMLQPLRLEIGGEALQPYLDRLSEQLQSDFLLPVRQLNADTSRTWQRTISVIGFALRTLMSVILFGIGMYLVIGSFQSLLAGKLDPNFLGAGVSFVTGLVTMVAVTFAGPLKEIRKSVNDVGASSAIFIAYIHSILQVSHTFSSLYQRGNMSFDEARQAAALVEATMRAAMEELNRREGDRPAALSAPVNTTGAPPAEPEPDSN
jgi:hypothetical protein